MWIYIGIGAILFWLLLSPARRKIELSDLNDMFTKGYFRWLVLIVIVEFLIALCLFPTFLSSFPFFSWLANSPHAIHFYLILMTILIIPKVIILCYVIEENPLMLKSGLVISLKSGKVYPPYLNYADAFSEDQAQQLSAGFDPEMREQQIQQDLELLEGFIDNLVGDDEKPTQEKHDANKAKIKAFQISLNEASTKRQQEAHKLITRIAFFPDRMLKKITNPGKRSMASRVFWAITMLLLTSLFVWFYADTMPKYLFASENFYQELNLLTLGQDREIQSALFAASILSSFIAVPLAISTLVIKDSIAYIKSS